MTTFAQGGAVLAHAPAFVLVARERAGRLSSSCGQPRAMASG